MPDTILTVSLKEEEWRVIFNCMNFVRENVDLCEDCFDELIDVGNKFRDQIIKGLVKEGYEFYEVQ